MFHHVMQSPALFAMGMDLPVSQAPRQRDAGGGQLVRS
jgi:hypothetical protein